MQWHSKISAVQKMTVAEIDARLYLIGLHGEIEQRHLEYDRQNLRSHLALANLRQFG